MQRNHEHWIITNYYGFVICDQQQRHLQTTKYKSQITEAFGLPYNLWILDSYLDCKMFFFTPITVIGDN